MTDIKLLLLHNNTWNYLTLFEFDIHLKKVGGHIGRNVVKITNMKTIVRKPLMKKSSSFVSEI